MKEINYLDAIRETTAHLEKGGVFLTLGGDTPNTMTIGWASVGYMWNRPIFTVLVRRQRYTYNMIRNAETFTVSVPTKDALREQLAFAGSASGRDVNKFEDHGITAAPAIDSNAPIIVECGLHFECRTVFVEDMRDGFIDPDVHDRCYPKDDYHVMFFGEIIRCYRTDEA